MRATPSTKELNSNLLRSLIAKKRETEGLSLRDAAESCGVAFSTLSRLERGEKGKPDLDTLERVAKWLEIPVGALFIRQRPIEAHLRARKNPGSETIDLLQELILAARRQYGASEAEPEYSEGDEIIEHGPIPRSQWEEIASTIRGGMRKKGDDPVDPFQLRIRGVKVALANDIRGLSDQALSMLLARNSSLWSAATIPLDAKKKEWLVLLNSSHSRERQRASLMEEYCHVLLGHEISRLTYQEGRAFRDFLEEQEQEAYYIGAAILVPEASLRRRVTNRESSDQIARHFGVSRELVEYRIKRLGLWPLYRLQSTGTDQA